MLIKKAQPRDRWTTNLVAVHNYTKLVVCILKVVMYNSRCKLNERTTQW